MSWRLRFFETRLVGGVVLKSVQRRFLFVIHEHPAWTSLLQSKSSFSTLSRPSTSLDTTISRTPVLILPVRIIRNLPAESRQLHHHRPSHRHCHSHTYRSSQPYTAIRRHPQWYRPRRHSSHHFGRSSGQWAVSEVQCRGHVGREWVG